MFDIKYKIVKILIISSRYVIFINSLFKQINFAIFMYISIFKISQYLTDGPCRFTFFLKF